MSSRRLSARRTSSRRASIDPSRLIPMDKFSFLYSPSSAPLTPHTGRAMSAGPTILMSSSSVLVTSCLAPTKGPGTTPSASNSQLSPPHPSFLISPSYSKLGPRLKVVAIIDPAVERATAVLQKKCDSFVVSAYRDTRIFKTLDDYVKNMSPKDRPRVIVIGSPPRFRGSLEPGRDVEMQILKRFPGVALFIEKPIATGPHHEIEQGFTIAKSISDSKTICSVGCCCLFLYRIISAHPLLATCSVTSKPSS